MKVLERMIQRIYDDKWDELEKLDKAFTVLEEQHGYPPKTRYLYISGGHKVNTLVVERLWDSMAAMEQATEKLQATAEAKELFTKSAQIVKAMNIEFLMALE